MPMKLNDIPKFERLNNISVSVYGVQEKVQESGELSGNIYPLKVTREERKNHVNLLFYSKGETQHYCLIRNFSRLVGSQYSKKGNELAYCRFCLHGFYGKEIKGECTRLENAKKMRDIHEKECFVHGEQLRVFPEEDNVEFRNIHKQLEAPFVVYADFEAILPECDNQCSSKDKTK